MVVIGGGVGIDLHLVQSMSSVWSVKTRRAPSRYCRDARVRGHTTTAMHDIEYTPHTPPVSKGTRGRWSND